MASNVPSGVYVPTWSCRDVRRQGDPRHSTSIQENASGSMTMEARGRPVAGIGTPGPELLAPSSRRGTARLPSPRRRPHGGTPGRHVPGARHALPRSRRTSTVPADGANTRKWQRMSEAVTPQRRELVTGHVASHSGHLRKVPECGDPTPATVLQADDHRLGGARRQMGEARQEVGVVFLPAVPGAAEGVPVLSPGEEIVR